MRKNWNMMKNLEAFNPPTGGIGIFYTAGGLTGTPMLGFAKTTKEAIALKRWIASFLVS